MRRVGGRGRGISRPVSVTSPRLGIRATAVTDAVARRFELPVSSGVLVVGVSPGSRAEEAGLCVGDVVVEVGGRPVTQVADLRSGAAAVRWRDLVIGVFRPAGSARTA